MRAVCVDVYPLYLICRSAFVVWIEITHLVPFAKKVDRKVAW